MWQTILEQFQNNQFLAGGGVLMALGAVAAYCRDVPRRVFSWLWDRLFMDLEIQMKDDAFWWFSVWLAEHGYSKRWARNLSVSTKRRRDEEDERGMPSVHLTPSPGRHFMFWRRRPMIVYRERKEAAGTNGAMITKEPVETYTISIMTRSREVCCQLLQEAYDAANPASDRRINLLMPQFGGWTGSYKVRPRPIDTVFLPNGVLDDLLEDMRWFLESEDWYVTRGIPYRRGYLLYGPPGNGKSSTVKALASELKLDICVAHLGSIDTDEELVQLFINLPHHSVVLLEDIDCVTANRAKDGDDDKKNLSMSALLNALDGVAAKEGRLLFMTTNHIEKLDAALIRPGRCDKQIYIGNADADQAASLFLRFFPEAEETAKQFHRPDTSMAALQGVLLGSATPEEAIREIQRADSDLSGLRVEDSQRVGRGVPLCDLQASAKVPTCDSV